MTTTPSTKRKSSGASSVTGDGRFPKGVSGNPGGLTKQRAAELKAFREAAQALVEPAMAHLADVLAGSPRETGEVAEGPDGVPVPVMAATASLAEMTVAAREVFDRAFGKAAQIIAGDDTLDPVNLALTVRFVRPEPTSTPD